MKKIFLIAALVCGVMDANAEDVLQIVPFKTTENVASVDAQTFELSLTNDNLTVNVLRFNLYLPIGMDIDTSFDEEGTYTAFDMNNDRTKYQSGRTIISTNHSAAYNKKEVSDKPGYIQYLVLISQGTTQTPIQDTKGTIAKAYYIIDNMPQGVYPIYIENIEITNTVSQTKVDVPSTTSYVVIGNPTNVSLTMEGEIPSFVNEKLATETAITNLDLSAVTAVNGTFTYVDGRAVTAPTDKNVTANATYTRNTAGTNTFGSFKAPFAATGCNNFYTFDKLEGEYANFTEATTIAAGDDLLVKGDIALSAENVVLGNVAAAQVKDDVYYVKDGRFYRGDHITINPLRTCWKLQGGNSNLMIAIDGEPTGIELNTIDGLNTPTYDLQGRRSENAQHGIFVTNGKKQIIK